MADPRRHPDDEPLTQLDVDIDKSQLDSLFEGEATTSPGEPPTLAKGPDDEPLTMEPPRVLGVPRLRARAHTMLGVAPPSSDAAAPPTTEPEVTGIPKIAFDGDEAQELTETKPADIPRIHVEGDDEQTTMVGKLLAEAHAQVAKRLKDKEADLYSDETATTVGDAEKILAAANEAALAKGGSAVDGDELDEPTASRSVRDALMEDATSKRDAINIDDALARAAELRAEAERKKRQAKKRTIHGLGDGPLTLPAKTKAAPPQDDIPTFENALPETGERPASTRSSGRLLVATAEPADGELETLSGAVPHPAPMRSIGTEPETMPVQVPSTPRERLATAPADPSSLLGGPPTPEQAPFGAPSFASTLNLSPGASPYTQPMPYAPTVRMDDNAGSGGNPALGNVADPALKQTMNSPMHQRAAPLDGPHPMTPSGGVQYHSTQLSAQQYSMQPHSGPAAFARTAVQTGSGPAVVEGDKEEKKGGPSAIVFLLFLLIAFGGIGVWQRAWLKATWDRYRQPAPQAAPSAESSPPASAVVSAAPTVPPPIAIDTAPHGSSSAAPRGSSSAAPHGSSSGAPHGSASAAPSASASAKTPPKKTPPPWKPPPPKPKPGGGGAAPKPVPKPIDDNRGF